MTENCENCHFHYDVLHLVCLDSVLFDCFSSDQNAQSGKGDKNHKMSKKNDQMDYELPKKIIILKSNKYLEVIATKRCLMALK